QYVLSFALILGGLSTLRFEMALPLARKRMDAIHILILALSLSAIVVLITTVLFLIDPPLLARLYQSLEFRALIFFIPVILFLEANNNVFSFWYTRTKNFKVSSIGKSFLGMGTALAQLTIAFSGFVSGFGLLLGYIIGQLASVSWYIFMFFKTNDAIQPHAVSVKGLIDQAKEHKNFPLFSSWNVLLNTLARNLPPLLLVSYFSVVEAGFFAIGIRLLNIPLNTLGMSVGQVYFQQIARY
ncbi:MAG: oligosaccharide flippase family protein, partial [Bacteroidota bacterium]|nr:oligosaccharide flippase family protein [Bacteroidota bacterium]